MIRLGWAKGHIPLEVVRATTASPKNGEMVWHINDPNSNTRSFFQAPRPISIPHLPLPISHLPPPISQPTFIPLYPIIREPSRSIGTPVYFGNLPQPPLTPWNAVFQDFNLKFEDGKRQSLKTTECTLVTFVDLAMPQPF